MIKFGSRWTSGAGCKARVIESDEQDVVIRWEGSFDDCVSYNMRDFLETFRENTEFISEPVWIQVGSSWWSKRKGSTVLGVVVGSLDGLVLVQVNDGEPLSVDPVCDFEGYGDDFVWHLGAPSRKDSPRDEMEAKMAAIQAELDELKRLLVR